jgi:HEAT repeat protein
MELPEELRRALEADDAEDFQLLLRHRRPEDREALLALLTTDPSVPADHRTKALYGLGQWGDPTVVPAIARLLPDLDVRGRIAALSALGRLPTPESVTALTEHVHDASPQVRKTAVVALSKSDAPEARATLQEVAAAEPVPWVRDLAARAVSE